jgi:hypothetical protein
LTGVRRVADAMRQGGAVCSARVLGVLGVLGVPGVPGVPGARAVGIRVYRDVDVDDVKHSTEGIMPG